jgi:hypothetical protein
VLRPSTADILSLNLASINGGNVPNPEPASEWAPSYLGKALSMRRIMLASLCLYHQVTGWPILVASVPCFQPTGLAFPLHWGWLGTYIDPRRRAPGIWLAS